MSPYNSGRPPVPLKCRVLTTGPLEVPPGTTVTAAVQNLSGFPITVLLKLLSLTPTPTALDCATVTIPPCGAAETVTLDGVLVDDTVYEVLFIPTGPVECIRGSVLLSTVDATYGGNILVKSSELIHDVRSCVFPPCNANVTIAPDGFGFSGW